MASRFIIFDGTPADPSRSVAGTTPTSSPSAGGPVDYIDDGGPVASYMDGLPLQVDTGGSFSSGDDLATDGSGRAVAAGTGDHVVARALEGSSGAGDTAWCVKAGTRIK